MAIENAAILILPVNPLYFDIRALKSKLPEVKSKVNKIIIAATSRNKIMSK